MTRSPDNRGGRRRRLAGPTLLAATVLVGLGSCAISDTRRPTSTPPEHLVAPQDQTPADLIVASMRQSLVMAGDRSWGEVLISLEHLSNYTHVLPSEFDHMRSTLAQELTRAGRTGRIPLRFVSEADEDVDYELTGTVYLVTAEGRDEWEMFLSMRQPGATWTVWRADSAVRMNRFGNVAVLRLGGG